MIIIQRKAIGRRIVGRILRMTDGMLNILVYALFMVGSVDLRDRAIGCLMGGAMGDAFGYPIEFMSLEEIKAAYGKEGLREPILLDRRYLISDDTQMTLLTADGLLYA